MNCVPESPASQNIWAITPMPAIVRRGGLHCGRHIPANRDLTTPNRDLTATKRGGIALCERCTVELAPRRGRHQTGGIAPLEARHAADTPTESS